MSKIQREKQIRKRIIGRIKGANKTEMRVNIIYKEKTQLEIVARNAIKDHFLEGGFFMNHFLSYKPTPNPSPERGGEGRVVTLIRLQRW